MQTRYPPRKVFDEPVNGKYGVRLSNIWFGEDPPEDTTKLWVETNVNPELFEEVVVDNSLSDAYDVIEPLSHDYRAISDENNTLEWTLDEVKINGNTQQISIKDYVVDGGLYGAVIVGDDNTINLLADMGEDELTSFPTNVPYNNNFKKMIGTVSLSWQSPSFGVFGDYGNIIINFADEDIDTGMNAENMELIGYNQEYPLCQALFLKNGTLHGLLINVEDKIYTWYTTEPMSLKIPANNTFVYNFPGSNVIRTICSDPALAGWSVLCEFNFTDTTEGYYITDEKYYPAIAGTIYYKTPRIYLGEDIQTQYTSDKLVRFKVDPYTEKNKVIVVSGLPLSEEIEISPNERKHSKYAQAFVPNNEGDCVRRPFRKYNPDTGVWERLDNFFGEE